MRTKQERSQLMALLQSPQWPTFIALAQELQTIAKENVGAKDTEWETLRDTLLAEGEVRGIRNLLQAIETEATYE